MIIHPDGRIEGTPEEIAEYQRKTIEFRPVIIFDPTPLEPLVHGSTFSADLDEIQYHLKIIAKEMGLYALVDFLTDKLQALKERKHRRWLL